MNKLTIYLMIILFAISGLMNNVLAQAPEGIIYQAEARNGKNKLITNEALDVKISIIQDIPAGAAIYEELHKVTTNNNGMFVLVIGQGTNTPGLLLENVDWGNHNHFLNVQVKKTKATDWINMGTSRLLSVPYALHAKTATEAFTADYNYLYNAPQNVSHFNNDAGYITAADNTDPDPTNEIQDLQLVDNILTITKNGNATQIDLSFYAYETDPVFMASEAAKIGAEDITKLSNLSGVNTGDQDISAMTHTNREALDAVSGINTGDQDLSTFATTADLDNKVDKEVGKRLFPNGATLGQMNYWNGTDWVTVKPGRNGQALTFCNGIPTWGPCPTPVLEVTSTTGAIWMDRNLGASQKATSSTDEAAYGDLYQWGRANDGHQNRGSGTTTSLSGTDIPGHSNFILKTNYPENWRSPENTNLWQGVNGINNPCPNGYRIPTIAELNAELLSWASRNSAGAYNSPLGLPVAGLRVSNGGIVYNGGYYWSSNIYSGVGGAKVLVIRSDEAFVTLDGCVPSAYGLSVRCMKDAGATGSIPTVTTSAITNNTTNTATGGGEVTSGGVEVTTGGSATVTARGVCWSTSPSPTIDLITKTVDGSGMGTFTSSITGLLRATTYYVRAYATNSVGTAYGNEVFFTTPTLAVGEVYNPTTGKIWMDRNLGASQVATGSTDAAAYGDLYQWGRGTDGHEKRNSGTTLVLSSSDTPGDGNFIMVPNPSVLKDWRSPQNIGLWQGVNGINNPCPNGFRIPTEAELIDEMASWSSQNIEGAFGSPLKLSAGGYRSHANGSLNDFNQHGFYWSNNVNNNYSRNIVINDDGSYMYSHPRSYGFSVRCIKDAGLTASIPSVTTSAVTNISFHTATVGGEVTFSGSEMVTASGVCWSTNPSPTIDLGTKTVDGAGTGTFTSSLTGLFFATTYYVRAYATNNVGTTYGNELHFTTPTPAIGDYYQGGKVFYIFQVGEPGYVAGQVHGLIAAPADQSTGIQWYNGSYLTTGATATALGAGKGNSGNIFFYQGWTISYAASLCELLVLNNYYDWYLPSKDELYLLYMQKNTIGGFANSWYWSSSEIDGTYAWIHNFDSSHGNAINGNKNSSYNVRAIRTF